MNPILFVTDYLRWHYSVAFLDTLRVFSNFFWFVAHTSSFIALVETLIAPWKRMHEDKPRRGTFDPLYYLGSLFVNAVMRLVGMVVRLFVIAVALVAMLLVVVVGIIFIFFWVIAPPAVVMILLSGLFHLM